MHTQSKSSPRFVGYVNVTVGPKVFALPVSALPLQSDDASTTPGGFFASDAGDVGILVDSSASPAEVQKQIRQGAQDAWNHLSRQFMN